MNRMPHRPSMALLPTAHKKQRDPKYYGFINEVSNRITTNPTTRIENTLR
jgi:hypothetical protein